MKTRWIAITAASALGIGTIAAGAMTVANAVEIRDAQGSVISSGEIRGDVVTGGQVEVKITGDHASVASPTQAPTATSAASAQTPQQPASPAAVDMPSANTVGSAYSVVEVESPGSPD